MQYSGMDRLTDFKLGVGIIIKAENDWWPSGFKLRCIAIASFPNYRYFV